MIEFELNEQKVKVSNQNSMKRLLDIIRETPINNSEAFFTGTKEGCGEGECGACSVLVNGELVNSCLVPVIQMNGKSVLTVEGIVGGDAANKNNQKPEAEIIVESFLKKGGAQCGICTPGMVVATKALIEKKRLNSGKNISREEIRNAIAGNLCRCTGYQKIVDAIEECFHSLSLGKE